MSKIQYYREVLCARRPKSDGFEDTSSFPEDDLDEALSKVSTYRALVQYMNDLGYEFCRDANGNNPSIIAKGWKRPVRLKSLGAKYDPEEMKEKIISNQLKKELYWIEKII